MGWGGACGPQLSRPQRDESLWGKLSHKLMQRPYHRWLVIERRPVTMPVTRGECGLISQMYSIEASSILRTQPVAGLHYATKLKICLNCFSTGENRKNTRSNALFFSVRVGRPISPDRASGRHKLVFA